MTTGSPTEVERQKESKPQRNATPPPGVGPSNIHVLNKPVTSFYRVISAKISEHNNKVSLAEYVNTKQLCILKTFSKPGGSQLIKARTCFNEEATLLRALDHPNIVRWFEIAEDSHNFYIITEALMGGEVLDYLADREAITEPLAARIIYQTLSALQYAHNQGVSHRSLKLCNLTLKEKPVSDTFHIKVTGFENACSFSAAKVSAASPSCYLAPEVYQGRGGDKSDVWSCGVILYMILGGDTPVSSVKYASCLGKKKTWTVSFQGENWTRVSAPVKELLTSMLAWEASLRPSTGECLQHPWIVSKAALSSLNSTSLRLSLSNLITIHACSMLKRAVKSFILTRVSRNSEILSLAESFRTLDRNGDGQITREELLAGLSKLMPPSQASQEADRIMRLTDKNENGKIDYSEFLSSSCNEKRLLCEENLREAFNSLDLDGEGKVKMKQLQHMFFTNSSKEKERLLAELMKLAKRPMERDIDFQEFMMLMQKATL